MAQISREALLRKRDVLELLGLSNSSFYNYIKAGVLKPGVPIGPRMKGWPASEIDLFVRSCIDARDNSAKLMDIHETAVTETPSPSVLSTAKKQAKAAANSPTTSEQPTGNLMERAK